MIYRTIFLSKVFCLFFAMNEVQTKNPIIASVKYKIKYIKDNKILINDACQLDITKTESYFYSLGIIAQSEYLEEKFQKSLQTGGGMNFKQNELKGGLL